MPVLYIKIREKNDFQAFCHVRIVIYHFGNRIDKLYDKVRSKITGRGFASENNGPGRYLRSRIFFDPVIKCNDVEYIKMLTLVFMDMLQLNIEERSGINGNSSPVMNNPRKITLIVMLNLLPLLNKCRIVGKGFELFDFFQLPDPAVSDRIRDKFRKPADY